MKNKKKLPKHLSAADKEIRKKSAMNSYRIKSSFKIAFTPEQFAEYVAEHLGKLLKDILRYVDGSITDWMLLTRPDIDYDKIYHRGDSGHEYNKFIAGLDVDQVIKEISAQDTF